MKSFILSLGIAALALMSSHSQAGLLCSIPTSLSGTPCVADTGDEFFGVSDIDGVDDDITSFVISRSSAFQNSVGIYDPFDTSNSLELWSGTQAPGFGSGVVLSWNGVDGYVIDGTIDELILTNLAYASTFGMYLDTGNGNRYYSDASLNSDGTDHLQTFYTEGLGGDTNAFDITFAWEDLDLGDADYNDIVYGCIDCTAVADITTFNVPVPGTAVLMGLGLLGLGVRKKMVN